MGCSRKGKIIITDGIKEKCISLCYLHHYKSIGWVRGRAPDAIKNIIAGQERWRNQDHGTKDISSKI